MALQSHRPTERVLDILQLLSRSPEGLTLTEISTEISAPKSSINPLVHTMAHRNFIYLNNDTMKYHIGVQSFLVGSTFANHMTSLQYIKRYMKSIVSKVSETCQVGIADRNELLYLAKEESEEPIRLVSYIGMRVPLHCTAIGKGILSCLPTGEVRALFPSGLAQVTPHTITDMDMLLADLAETKKRNYAIEQEEAVVHVHCIAVPLRRNNLPVAGLSVTVPAFRMTDEKQTQIISLLQEAQISIETYFEEKKIDWIT